MNRKLRDYFLGLGISLAILLTVWLLAGWLGYLAHKGLPWPGGVLEAGVEGLRDGYLFKDLLVSMARLIPAIVIGSALGAAVGLVTGRARFLAITIGPSLHMWRALPAVALIPIVVKIFGIGDGAKIFMIASGVFFPVWVSAHTGASLVDDQYLDLAATLELRARDWYLKIVAPAALPHILSGIRIGAAVAYVMLFVTEWMAADAGIGYRISIGHIVGRTDLMVLGLLELAVLAYSTDWFVYKGITASSEWLPKIHA